MDDARTLAVTAPDSRPGSKSKADMAQMTARAGEAARHLRLLANENRLLILCRLTEAGEMSVGELARAIDLSQSALSQHLARLRAEGLVGTARQGQSIRYRIIDPDTAEILAALYRLYCSDTPSPSEG